MVGNLKSTDSQRFHPWTQKLDGAVRNAGWVSFYPLLLSNVRRDEEMKPLHLLFTHTHTQKSKCEEQKWVYMWSDDDVKGERRTSLEVKLQEEEDFTPPSPSLLSHFFSWLVFFSEVSQFLRSRSPAATQRAAVDSLQLFLLSTRVFLRGGPAELLAPHTALHFNAPTPNKNSCCPESAEEAGRVTRSALIGCSSKDEWVHFH